MAVTKTKASTTPTKRRGRTRADEIYMAIRQDILDGTFMPGARLSPTALSQTHNVSATVVREALTRLVAISLVQSQSQQGFAVMSMTLEDLKDLTDMRILIDSEGLRRSIKSGDLEWQGRIMAAHHMLANTPDNSEGYNNAHTQFHEALISGCGSKRLLEQSKALHAASELYRRLSKPLSKGKRHNLDEHKAMMDSSLAGDHERATELLAQHYSRTLKILVDSGVLTSESKN